MRRERRASTLNPGWRHALATQAPQAKQREKQMRSLNKTGSRFPGRRARALFRPCRNSLIPRTPSRRRGRGSGPGRVSSHPLPARTAHLSVGLLYLFFKPKPNKYAIY